MNDDSDDDDELKSDQLLKVEDSRKVPLDFHFLKYEDEDDEEDANPEKVEIAEAIPLDYKFVHYQNEEGDELVKIERSDVPLNFNFLQMNAPDDSPVKIETLVNTGDSIPLNFRF